MIIATTNTSEIHTRHLEGAARMVGELELLQKVDGGFTWMATDPKILLRTADNAAWLIANVLLNARELDADPDLERRCWAVAERVGLRAEVEYVIAEAPR